MTKRLSAALATMLLAVAAVHATPHDQFRFVGTVVTMDTKADELTLKARDAKGEFTVKIWVHDKVSIERDGKPAARADLTPGVYVVVDATGDGYDDLEGQFIRIVPPPAPAR